MSDILDFFDSFNAKSFLSVGGKQYPFFDVNTAAKNMGKTVEKMPVSLKILLENMLRNENGAEVSASDISALVDRKAGAEVNIKPYRVLLQDFTGVPVIVDLGSMRSYIAAKGGNPEKINPITPVHLVTDHSLEVSSYGKDSSFIENVEIEIKRNAERYELLKWGKNTFKNFSLVPPGTGICHQINIEYLSKVVVEDNGILIPDTLIGTDSHTTMVNSMSILGWGVGGIEAEAAMLGQYIGIVLPEVFGVKLTGNLPPGTTSTDLVLTITNILRKKGVVGKFVEFFGDGLNNLSLFDRATIANMAPECGSTCNFFAADQALLDYLEITGKSAEHIELVEKYMKAQGFWRTSTEADYSDVTELDLAEIKPVVAGPNRPQDKIFLPEIKKSVPDDGRYIKDELSDGSVVVAAITSCTNTSNPKSMIAAGLMARNAIKAKLNVKPWVKTSFAPGSQVVTEYMNKSGLQKYLDELGFNLVGYGCTTCIGNSGKLKPDIQNTIDEKDLRVAAVLSGNRNFEGRIHPAVKYAYLASPPLVVFFALTGTVIINPEKEPIGINPEGKKIYLKDIWPSDEEINSAAHKFVTADMFTKRYSDVFSGSKEWSSIKSQEKMVFDWDPDSTYIKNPPYFDLCPPKKTDKSDFALKDALILAFLGDSITTDHISPAGAISKETPAGKYLMSKGVAPDDFNSYGSRRGNHEVMMRGTLANKRLKNKLADGQEGGLTKYIPSGKVMTIFDASEKYKSTKTPLVIIAGKEYGSGSSRDWAAKGVMLLGVSVVIAKSFERIHRSNLIGMGVLPLQFEKEEDYANLDGTETITFEVDGGDLSPHCTVKCKVSHTTLGIRYIRTNCMIFTKSELSYFSSGGILQYALADIESATR